LSLVRRFEVSIIAEAEQCWNRVTYFNWEKLKKAIVEVEDEILVMLAVSPCWHESQIDHRFCDECSPFHKVEDVADVRAAEAAEKLTTDTDSNTSDGAVNLLNVGRCLGRISCFPLLNSTSYDLVFIFELTYILRFELTVIELILDFRFHYIDDFFRTVCELLYEHLICVCVCVIKNLCIMKKIFT